MKKTLAIPIVVSFLLIGSSCALATTSPLTPLPTYSNVTSNSSTQYPSFASSGAFAPTTTKLFSDPNADFTLEYPSTWKYHKDLNDVTNSNVYAWDFEYDGKLTFEIVGYMEDPRGFDGCWPNHILEEKIYSTNEP